jgi:hypothetical protein
MDWQGVLLEPAKTLFARISEFLVNTLLVIIILIIGWVISKLIKTIVTKVLKAIRIDNLSERIKLDTLLAKGGLQYSLSALVGVICYWLALLVTFVVAINAIGLTIAADLLNQVVLYIPNVIAAIFILIAGMFIASLLKTIIQTAASNAGISHINLLGKVVEIAVIVFTIAIALEQLKIGAKIIELMVGVMLGSIGLAVGLAFGLGCKDIAARTMSDFVDKVKKK